MVSQNNRVPRQNITYPSPSFFIDGSIDSVFLENSPDAIKINQGLSGYNLTGSFVASAKSGTDPLGTASLTTVQIDPNLISPQVNIDVPDLADIESITFEEYPDSITGIAKYNAVIKIRNSSKNKSNISGVDARIYNPNSPNTYTFTTTTTATGSSASTVVSKTTWYNATSKCNPFSGVYGSQPTIVATAQYQSDGKDVPADSISGPYSARIKSVWRKTSDEALEAAKNSACELELA